MEEYCDGLAGHWEGDPPMLDGLLSRFQHRKNLLVCRKRPHQDNCLLYLGHEDDKLGTNACLLSSWSKKDILSMGKHIYNFVHAEMEERFYCSGGIVRWFTVAEVDALRIMVKRAVARVEDVSDLVSNRFSITSGKSQAHNLRRKFWKDPKGSCIDPDNWEQVVDSEYALSNLSIRLRTDTLSQYYEWARSSGNGSLAGLIFEIYLYRLAADNRLILHISEYDLAPQMTPNGSRHFDVKQVRLKKGKNLVSGTTEEYKTDRIKWRDDERFTYWYPQSHNFPNIDGIAKLESGNVAYLQFTAAATHGINSNHLRGLDEFCKPAEAGKAETGPIYIAVCQNEKRCKNFVLGTRQEVIAAKEVCPVYVGYYTEDSHSTAADGPNNRVPITVLQPHKYFTRRKRRTRRHFAI